ncbi:hypothetical protein [Streptomyces sp. NPDC056690]|uniref:hypothetical protein n=1 Tax=Streptomyces sp. NPDC056690 TaxID=3345912 RepID=UPI003697C71E
MLERFRVNRAGLRELLKSDGVRADLEARARRVATAARARGDGVLDRGEGGIVADSYTGRSRAGATVIGVPMDIEARDRVLGASIDAARGES